MSYQVIYNQKEFHYNQGTIQIDYQTLFNLFGEPKKDIPKSDAVWIVRFYDEEIEVSIYNWNPNKDRFPLNPEEIQYWTIGGSTKKSFQAVKSLTTFNLDDMKKAIEEI